jgi:hypothetical protein
MRILRRPASALRGLSRLPVLLVALMLGALAVPGAAHAQPGHAHAGHGAQPAKTKSHHPAPRPGITAARVLRADSVPERAREAYTIAARIPDVLDGLFCHCDCHEREGLRSLLECFEEDMATTCAICQNQAVAAGEMRAAGKSLAQIRAAIDRRWGCGFHRAARGDHRPDPGWLGAVAAGARPAMEAGGAGAADDGRMVRHGALGCRAHDAG